MSFQTWHTYGYGICTDDIKAHDVERLKELLLLAPVYDAKIKKQLSEARVENPDWVDYMECDQDYDLGIATILREVIEEAEKISFVACDNFDGEAYLLYPPQYPWKLNDIERKLTKDQVEEIIRRYVGILTDEPIEIDDQGVENGG